MYKVLLTYRDWTGRYNERLFIVLAPHAEDAHNQVMEKCFNDVKGGSRIFIGSVHMENVVEIT